MTPATATAQTRYILSKDGSVQIAVEITDALHALIWGRLGLSTQPHDCPLICVPNPTAWVQAERMIGQLTMSERLAARRAKLAPQMQDAA